MVLAWVVTVTKKILGASNLCFPNHQRQNQEKEEKNWGIVVPTWWVSRVAPEEGLSTDFPSRWAPVVG